MEGKVDGKTKISGSESFRAVPERPYSTEDKVGCFGL
jgi:hypothetical protein